MRVNVLQLGDMEYEGVVFVPQAEGGDGRKRQWGAGLPKNVPIFEVKCPQNRANSVIWNMRGRFLRQTGNGGHGVKMGARGGEKQAEF